MLFSAENRVRVAVRAELMEQVFKNLISYSQVNAIEIFFFQVEIRCWKDKR